MARPKTYIIKLSDDERTTLQNTIKNKNTCKTVLKRCQILLELDEKQGAGLTHAQIAHSYAVCKSTVANVVRSYMKNGITDIIRYNISPNSALARRKVDGRMERISFRLPVARFRTDTLIGLCDFWRKGFAWSWTLPSGERPSARH